MRIAQLLRLLNGRPLLTRKDLARHFSCDVRSIDRWRVQGIFPRPFYINCPMWKPEDIDRYEKERRQAK